MNAGGSFDWRTALNHPSCPLDFLKSANASNVDHAFEQEGHEQHDICHDRRHRGFRMGDVDDAFVDRNARAKRKDEHGDDEAPEIELAAVAEGMELVGRALGCTAAPHQQQLVGRIDDAVHAFGQHRRGTGDRGRDELRHGDAEVRQKRDDERPRTGGVRAHEARKLIKLTPLRARENARPPLCKQICTNVDRPLMRGSLAQEAACRTAPSARR